MVSVVITAYNVSEYIERCISSVANQSYDDLEIIVVNDASTDDTLSVVNKFDDRRLIIINNDINLGAGMSRRIGIKKSVGEFVMLLDGDDYISPDYIQSLYNNSNGYDIISGGVTVAYEDSDVRKVIMKPIGIFEGDDKYSNEMDGTTVMFLNNKLVRRELYNKVEYSDRRYIEDTQTLLKLLYYSNKTRYIDNSGYYYVQRHGSLIHSSDKKKKFIYKTLYVIDIMEFLKEHECEYLRNIYNIHELLAQFGTLRLNNLRPEDFIEYRDEWNYIVNYIKENS